MKDVQLQSLLTSDRASEALFEAGFFFGDLKNDAGTTSMILTELGFEDDELRGGGYQRRIHPEDLPTYLALWNRVNEGWEDRLYCEYRVSDPAGEWHWIETHAVVVDRRSDGSIGTIVGTDRDISSRKGAEEVLQNQFQEVERRYEVAERLRETSTLVSSSPKLIENLRLSVERIASVVEFERCEVYSIEEGVSKLRLAVPLERINEESNSELLELLSASAYPVIRDDVIVDGDCHSWLGVPLRSGDLLVGAAYLWHSSPGRYRGTDLYPVRALGEILAAAIVSDLNLTRAVADYTRDELTGFLTRKSFDREIDERWSLFCSMHASNSVAMVDIDHFKDVNDHHGHLMGDRVISGIAEIFKERLRGDDILARYGGEEFLIVLPHTSLDEAMRTMDRIRTECAEHHHADIDAAVTISIGVASQSGAVTMGELIARADAALYRAKAGGRDRVERGD